MGKTVLVTGASKGIGKAIVEYLCDSGADIKVLGIARSLQDLQDLKSKFGSKFSFLCADITDEVAVGEFLASQLDGIDAVIANAGVLSPVQGVAHADTAQWKSLFDINFFSVVSLVARVLPQLKESKQGDVILVSSGASTKPYYAWGAYGASKAALNHFAQTLAFEEPQVRTVAIAPGVVNTQMQDEIRDRLGPSNMTPEALKRFTDLHEKGELLDPEVPAAVYANLALKGISPDINGKYLRYNDAQLAEYS
ncbi:LANO_0F17414g1_1 [Lachancea nothofagi CBS 11611]|uniref:LANO_0F17414g1_1 n=1 Tax=Lachancea nothofagi CBS 11611 TaxID=1266666 RepID=A0A1G4KD98_9SACH|nr:LANO_0F17414g1_1 [Lachancea nothofagi CBS 11611]